MHRRSAYLPRPSRVGLFRPTEDDLGSAPVDAIGRSVERHPTFVEGDGKDRS